MEIKTLSLACPVGDPVEDPEPGRREYNRRELGRREPLAVRLRLSYRLSGNSHPSWPKTRGERRLAEKEPFLDGNSLEISG